MALGGGARHTLTLLSGPCPDCFTGSAANHNHKRVQDNSTVHTEAHNLSTRFSSAAAKAPPYKIHQGKMSSLTAGMEPEVEHICSIKPLMQSFPIIC